MRRLLVFGTGAAVIGIVLLIVAFYEAYLIVSTLQREVGNQLTNTNVLLEDATLEAVFLGVMAALGYGLVAKGLDGIRRQELLEMEGPALEYGREQVKIREDRSQAGRPPSPGGAGFRVRQEQTKSLHPGIKSPADKSVPYDVPVMPAPWSPSPETREEEYAAQPAPEPSLVEERPPVEPQVQSPTSSITEPVSASPEATIPESSTTGQSTVPEGSTGQSSEWHPEEPKQGEVVWETEAPPRLAGVEVLPEPATHGAAAALNVPYDQPNEAQVQQTAQVDTPTGAPVKRRRGRPKGSKSAKKTADNETTSTPSSSSTT